MHHAAAPQLRSSRGHYDFELAVTSAFNALPLVYVALGYLGM